MDDVVEHGWLELNQGTRNLIQTGVSISYISFSFEGRKRNLFSPISFCIHLWDVQTIGLAHNFQWNRGLVYSVTKAVSGPRAAVTIPTVSSSLNVQRRPPGCLFITSLVTFTERVVAHFRLTAVLYHSLKKNRISQALPVFSNTECIVIHTYLIYNI